MNERLGNTTYAKTGLIIGGLSGFALGFALGTIGVDERIPEERDFWGTNKLAARLTPALIGVGIGGLIGMFIGADIKKPTIEPPLP